MIRLIADSGSTKTTWSVAEQKPLLRFTTLGLNPHLTSQEQFLEILHGVSSRTAPFLVSEVYFYGAGCGTEEMCNTVAEYLHCFYLSAKIFVASDLLGACRAVCGNSAGVVGILGTGSNACLYDGERIIKQQPSLGYVLGDEGSGNHIGRILVKDYFSGRMDASLRPWFQEMFQFSHSSLLDHLYHQPYPNRYLASFVPFAIENRQSTYIQSVLSESFSDFMKTQVLPLGQGTLNLVGSVAYTFQEELAQVAAPMGIEIGEVIKEPIERL